MADTQQYKLRGPDGVIHTLEGPVGASDRQIQEALVYQLNQQEKDPLAGDDSALRRVSDIGIDVGKGVIGVVDAVTGLADIPTGGAVGKFTDELSEELFGGTTEDAKAFLDKGTSRQGLRAEREVAEAEGFGGTLSAMVQNPSTIIGTVAESLPAMFGGGKIAQGLLKLNKYRKAQKLVGETPGSYGVAAGIGEGVVGAGQQATDIRRQTDDQTLSGKQAGLSALTGIFTAVLGTVGAKIANKVGIVDADVLFAEGVQEGTKRGLLTDIAYAAITEGAFEELPQSIQEQILQNVALNKDPMEGVAESAATGLLAGIGMGGGAALLTRGKRSTIKDDKEGLAEDPVDENEPPQEESKFGNLGTSPVVSPITKPKAKAKPKPKAIEQFDDYEQNKLPDETEQQFYIRRNQEKIEAENQGENVNEEIQITAQEGGGTPLTQESKFFPITPTNAPGVGGSSNVSEPGGLDAAGAPTPVATDGGGLAESTGIAGGPVATEGEQQSALKEEELTQEEKNEAFEQEYNKQSKEQFELRKSKGQEYVKANKLNLHPFEISGSKYAGSSPLQSIKTNQKTKDSKIIFNSKPNIEQIRKKALIDANYVIALKDVESADTTAINEEINKLQTTTYNKKRQEYKKKFTAFKKLKENKSLAERTLKTKFNKKFPDLKPKEQEGGTTFPQALQTKEYENKVRKIYEKHEGKLDLKELDIELQEDINRAQEYINSLSSTSKLLSNKEIEENKNKIRNRLITRLINKRNRIDTPKAPTIELPHQQYKEEFRQYRKQEKDKDKNKNIKEIQNSFNEQVDKETDSTEVNTDKFLNSLRNTPSLPPKERGDGDPVLERQAKVALIIAGELLDGEGNPNPPINIKIILNEIGNLYGVNARIAQRLLRVKSNTKIQAGNVKGNKAGQYDPKTNTITINLKNLDGNLNINKLNVVNVILHESMHSSLDHIIDSTARYDYLKKKGTKITTAEKAELKVINQNLTATQRNSVKELKNIRKQLQKFYTQSGKTIPVGLREQDDLNELIAYSFEGKNYQGSPSNLQQELENISQDQLLATDRKDGKISVEKRKNFNKKRENFLELISKLVDSFVKVLGFTEGSNKSSSLAAIATQVDIILSQGYEPAVAEAAEDFGLRGKETRFKEGRKSVGVDADGTPVNRKWKIGKTKEEIAKFSTKKSGKSGVNKKVSKRVSERLIKDEKSAEQSMQEDIDKAIKNAPDQRSIVRQVVSNINTQTTRQMLQNDRAAIVELDQAKETAGELETGGDNANNIATIMDSIFGKADFVYKREIQEIMSRYKRTIAKWVDEYDGKPEDAVEQLHLILQAIHESERRHVKYLKNVPLTEAINLTWVDGSKVSANQYRLNIIEELGGNLNLSKNDALGLRKDLETLVQNYADINGGTSAFDTKGNPDALDETSVLYNVTENNHETEQKRRDSINNNPKLKEIQKNISIAMKQLQDATLKVNSEAGFNTSLSQNFINFYNFNNYVPLKGRPQFKEGTDPIYDSDFDYTGTKLGGTARDIAVGLEGRDTSAKNSVVQSIVEAIHATARVGRKGLTKAIINNINQGHIKGKVGNPISLIDRYLKRGKGEIDTSKLGENDFIHENEDGSIQVITLDNSPRNSRIVRAIRKPINNDTPNVDKAWNALNAITSKFGQMHTRYNPAFPLLNFIRDAITNFFIIAVENPSALPLYTMEIAKQMLVLPMVSTNRAVAAYVRGDIKSLEKAAKKAGPGSIQADMLDFFQSGGNVSYIQSLATNNQLQDVLNASSKFGKNQYILQGRENFNGFFDKLVGTFELSVRLAAFRAIKHQRKSLGLNEKQAIEYAAIYSKDLANFEQTGEWGKQLGALYMFFRPSATGAVRALDAISPALRTLTVPVGSGGRQVQEDRLPDSIKNDPAKLETWRNNYTRQMRNGMIVSIAALGFGALMYNMSKYLSGDDEEGRNITDADNMSRWTRFSRFQIGEYMIQIPWGFGLGGLAAVGAQLAALEDLGGSTYNEKGKIARNISEILLDSFLPIPISRIDYTDNLSNASFFVMDTLAPSFVRPWLELQQNTSGFGYQVYRQNNRYGQAYAAGDNTPEMYKDAAMWLSDSTGKEVQISPDILYFLSNNYFDGPGRILHNLYEGDLLVKGKKNPNLDNVSKSTMAFDSFISTQTKIVAEDFQKTKNKLETKFKQLDAFILDENNYKPGIYEFLAKPENIGLEDAKRKWNKLTKGGNYSKLQQELSEMRVNTTIPLKERNKNIKELKAELLKEKREILLDIEEVVPQLVKPQSLDSQKNRKRTDYNPD